MISPQLAGWAPGTRHYKTSDGKHLAVEATQPQGPQIIQRGQSPMVDEILTVLGKSVASLKVVARPTVVFLCTAEGLPVDADEADQDPLTPLAVFPSGTTHEEALAELGYT